MTTDYHEKEQAFLASLKATTGRDLREWMAAIRAENCAHRNEVIDWLREQGFPFARASWLERIFANGGRPLYEGAEARQSRPAMRRIAPAPLREAPKPDAPSATVLRLTPRPQPAPQPKSRPKPLSEELDRLLTKAKAFKPLAHHLLREIEKAVPDAAFTPQETHVSLGAPNEFGALVVGAKELRLGLRLGSGETGERFMRAKFGSAMGVSPDITHMTVLNDARQVDPELMGAIRAAAKGTAKT